MSKWKPRKDGMIYWYLTNGMLGKQFELEKTNYSSDSDVQKARISTGNCFKTEKEALSAKKAIEAILKN